MIIGSMCNENNILQINENQIIIEGFITQNVFSGHSKGLSEAVSRVMEKHGVSTAMRSANKLRNIISPP